MAFLKNLCTILIIHVFFSHSDCNQIAEFSEAKAQVAELRAEVERQGKLLQELIGNHDLDSVEPHAHSCYEAAGQASGIFEIQVRGFSLKPFRVVCEKNNHGDGWTIILRRQDGSEDFYRNWNDYKNGFGDLKNEFFMGLEKIHAITAAQRQELLVLLEDEDGEQSYERYDRFAIGDELESFALHTLGNANGTAGDSLEYHHDQKFTTFDRDNDSNQLKNCAKTHSAAWWYNSCFMSNLNGKYNDNIKGIYWAHFKDLDYSLKRAVMMIRPII